jgi:hypothetical protein
MVERGYVGVQGKEPLERNMEEVKGHSVESCICGLLMSDCDDVNYIRQNDGWLLDS